MSVQLFCAIFLVLGGFANANKSSGLPHKDSSASHSQSSSSVIQSTSSSSSTSYASSTTSVDCNEGKCDQYSTYKMCPAPCPPSCENPKGDPYCKKMCEPYGCECNPGYVASENGKCVLLKDCPGKCDCNSNYKECPDPCPPSCENPKGVPNCKKKCEPYGCECNPGYVASENGKCVLLKDCPEKQSFCGLNEMAVECRTQCPPQSCAISYTEYLCQDNIPCEFGCDCLPNFLRNASEICIPSEECPPPELFM